MRHLVKTEAMTAAASVGLGALAVKKGCGGGPGRTVARR
jgi:hypothetical protein